MPPQERRDGTEAMAFELILHKLMTLEQDMRAIPPLLAKIITQLEAQAKQPDVPVARYDALYPALHEGAAEDTEEVVEVVATPTPVPQGKGKRRRLWHWLLKEAP